MTGPLLSARQAFAEGIRQIIEPLRQHSDPFADPEVLSPDANAENATLLNQMRAAIACVSKGRSEMISTGLPASTSTATNSSDELWHYATLLAPALSQRDGNLILKLCELLNSIDRLLQVCDPIAKSAALSRRQSLSPASNQNMAHDDAYGHLRRGTEAFKAIERTERDLSSSSGSAGLNELRFAEQAVLWVRIDDLIEDVQHLCRSNASNAIARRREPIEKEYEPSIKDGYTADSLPEYTPGETDALPPDYIERLQAFADEKAVSNFSTPKPNEKDHFELDSITSAIERLYDVAPQLANQRVDGSSRKDRKQIREMQLTRLGIAIERLSKGRLEDQRATLSESTSPTKVSFSQMDRARSLDRAECDQVGELNRLLDAVSKASNSDMTNQRVALSPRQRSTLDEARKTAQTVGAAYNLDAQELARQNYILEKTGSGRIEAQDAEPSLRIMRSLANLSEGEDGMRRRSVSGSFKDGRVKGKEETGESDAL